MKLFPVVMICVFLITKCSSLNIVSYDNWDKNRDKGLDGYEFISGYIGSNYFNRWGKGKNSINYNTFYVGIFKSVDSDNNEEISPSEFSSKLYLYIKGSPLENFSKWDKNSNATIDENEFLSEIGLSRVAPGWDPSKDGNITKREFAGQMFKLADADSNGSVSVLEFNIWHANR